MKMNRTVASVILVCLFVVVNACVATTGSSNTVPAQSAIQKIVARGELVVGTEGNMPPFNMITKGGQLVGIEIDMAKRMAEELGVAVRFETMPFIDLAAALESGKVDMVLSNVTITSKRNRRFAFVGPYFVTTKSILTKKDTIAKAKTPGEVNLPEIRLAAKRGTTSQIFVQEKMPDVKLKLVGTYEIAVEMLRNDQIDGMVADYPICAVHVLKNPADNFVTVITPFTVERIGIALPPSDAHLINWTENFLENLQSTGELASMKEKWILNRSWLDDLK